MPRDDLHFTLTKQYLNPLIPRPYPFPPLLSLEYADPAVATDESPLFFYDFVVVVVVVVVAFVIDDWLFAPVVVVGVLVVIAISRSNNYSIDPNLWSVLFQTTPFVNSPINQSSLITTPHPPTRFHCPLHFSISKNGGFTPKQALFTDFQPFFARSWVIYQPIFKWFSFSDSFQKALQHCRSKFVASQTSLHENNYLSFFRVNSVSVR